MGATASKVTVTNTTSEPVLVEACEDNSWRSDKCVIKLLQPVTFSASVAPVCLPPPLQQGQDQPSLEGGRLYQY